MHTLHAYRLNPELGVVADGTLFRNLGDVEAYGDLHYTQDNQRPRIEVHEADRHAVAYWKDKFDRGHVSHWKNRRQPTNT